MADGNPSVRSRFAAENAALASEWRRLPGGTTIACIVADDVPGLLSLVSAAFVAHHLDVTSAQIFCRANAAGRAPRAAR